MMNKDRIPETSCHDSHLRQVAERLGVKNPAVVNKALSLGEQPYGGEDRAEEFLVQTAVLPKPGKMKKSRISPSKRREILERHGLR